MNAPTPFVRVVGLSLLVVLVVSLLLTVFAWPAVHTAPNKLPLGLVAPPPAAAQIRTQLEQTRPGGFELRAYPSEIAARAGIHRREVYGAFIFTSTGPRILTASAASPAVAQLLVQVSSALTTQSLTAQSLTARSRVGALKDVVPAQSADPRQAGLAGAALPLVLSGILSGVLLTSQLRGGFERTAAVLLIALFGGFSVAGILQGGFGTLGGDYLLNSLAAALGVGAAAAFVVGSESVLGARGLALAAATLMLVGNPFSALSSAPEMLPGIWGAVGQLLPPGAFGSLMRSVAFFDGQGAIAPLVVLSSWLLLGLALIGMGAVRKGSLSRSSATPAVS